MAIDLTRFEQGKPFPGDGPAALAALQQRLARLNTAQVAHGRRLIVLLEGWDGAGRKPVLRQMLSALDPCRSTVHCATMPMFADEERHWLTPFWTRLPRSGETALYYGSWYRRPLDQRILGAMDEAHWGRAFDEINEFEAQQLDSGTLLVKLFFHISEAVRGQRLRNRAADPWQRAVAGHTTAVDRDSAMTALKAMFKATDTRWAPWQVIDSNDEQAAQIAALTILTGHLEAKLPAEPPAGEAGVVPFTRVS